jgi:hypothetical protein
MSFVVTVIVGIGVVMLWPLSVVLSEASTRKATEPMAIGERCRLRLLDASAGIALPSIEVKS